MTKKEKVQQLMELCGMSGVIQTLIAEFGQDTEDVEFGQLLIDILISVHTKIFQENLSDSEIDNLIFIFSNPALKKSLELLNKLSNDALQICDAEILKFEADEFLKDYIQHNADKKEVN